VAELTKEQERIVSHVKGCFDHANKNGERRQQSYIDRYRAFRGVLELADDTWHSNLSPPYIFQIIEMVYSMICSEHPRDTVMPMGVKDMAGAEALNELLPIQRRHDNFDEKYAQWVKQSLVLGVSPAKIGWASERRLMTRRVYNEITGELETVEEELTVKDQPTFSYIDASDFFWDPSASRMDEARYVIARWWVTLDSLKRDPNYENLDLLKDAPRGYGGASAMKDETIRRDKEKLVEVLEYWDADRLIVLANRSVPIRHEANPLWHGKLPFIVATPVPDLYSMEGMSEVELIMDIQAAIWTFLNQRLDNVRLISNAIVMIRDTMDDPEKLIFEPGAIWPVRDPQEVMLWTPNQDITKSSLEAEAELKSDLLNLTAAMQYLGGASPDEMQNNTATGINIMSNNAMNRVLTKRQRIFDSLKDKGYQEIGLNQQLWQGPIEIRLPGLSKEVPWDFKEVHVQDILCDYSYEIEEATESMNRQERRTEAMQLVQVIAPLVELGMQTGVLINIQPLVERLLESFDIKNTEMYVGPMPAPVDPNAMLAAPPGAGTPPNGGPPPGSNGLAGLVPGLAERLQGGA